MAASRKGRWSDRLIHLSGERHFADLAPYAGVNTLAWTPGREMAMHGHTFLQVIHVIDGRLDVDWGTGWKTIAAGQAHVLPAGQRHRLRSTGHRQLGINFRADGADPRRLRGLLEAAATATVVTVPTATTVTAIAIDLEGGGDQALAALGTHLDAYCLDLLAALAPVRHEGSWPAVEAYLRAHEDGPLRIAEVASAVGLARSRLQELCHQRYGCGLAHLHEARRLQRAARLLISEAGAGIGDIARACGYAEVSAFARAFRRQHGCAPTAFRSRLVAG